MNASNSNSAQSFPLSFDTAKKGYDTAQVESYFNAMKVQHDQDIKILAARILDEQQGRSVAEASKAQMEALRIERDQALSAAAEVETLRVSNAEAAEKVASLTVRLQEEENSENDNSGLLAEIEAANNRIRDMDAQLHTASSASEQAEHLQSRIQELEMELFSSNAEDTSALYSRIAELEEAAEENNDAKAWQAHSVAVEEQLTGANARIQELESRPVEDTSPLHNRIQELEHAASAVEDTSILHNKIQELEGQLIQELEHAASAVEDASVLHNKIQELEGQLIQAQVSPPSDNAELHERIHDLENELETARASRQDFGAAAQKMLQALSESREEQREQMQSELDQARADAARMLSNAKREGERMHEEARVNAERVKMDALVSLEQTELERRRVESQARDRIQEISSNLRDHVQEMEDEISRRELWAHDHEVSVRKEVQASIVVEVKALAQQRDALVQELDRLTERRDAGSDEWATRPPAPEFATTEESRPPAPAFEDFAELGEENADHQMLSDEPPSDEPVQEDTDSDTVNQEQVAALLAEEETEVEHDDVIQLPAWEKTAEDGKEENLDWLQLARMSAPETQRENTDEIVANGDDEKPATSSEPTVE